MDKGHRSLLSLCGGIKRRHSWAGQDITRGIITKSPSKTSHSLLPKFGPEPGNTLNNVESPFFCGIKPCKKTVAITDHDGDVTYDELFKRSFYLSLEIKKALKNQPNRNQKINLICPNGVSYVVGQWAIWMSGNIVVPLSGQHSDNALEYFIKDSESSLVISSPELMSKVEDVAKKTEKPLICQDKQLANQANIDIDSASPLIFEENLYEKDAPVMMLYLPITGQDKPQQFLLKHKDLNRELELINRMWNLDENSTLLHALSLYNPYGIIASLMSPLSVGGRVVLLPQFDTMKVWSHLLGIQINGEYVPRTNIYAGVPTHYDNLMKRYKEVFTAPKIKNHVKETCSKRINLMVNGMEYLDNDLHKEWAKVTGHNIQLY